MNSERLLRAMRAAQAVTLGGAALVGACGTRPAEPEDAGTDVGADAQADVLPDAQADAPDTEPDGSAAACLDIADGVCPETCTVDDDRDCCEAQPGGLCSYQPGAGCTCAIEGPFAPPSLPRRRRDVA